MRKLFAALVAAVILAQVPAGAGALTTTLTTVAAGSWSNPVIWNGGRVPTASDVVEIGHAVQLDTNATVAGVTVRSAGTLAFGPAASRTLTSTGNVVVSGTLQMRPASDNSIHTLRFAGINEAAFVGHGMDPKDSDVGLWIMGGGRLDAVGAARSGWLRTAGGVNAGATSITLESAPVGWAVGDEIVVAPTRAGDLSGFEVRTITGVSGATVSLSAPLSFPHPVVDGSRPEVANLTRNVRIEGTPTGRTHVFIHSTLPQTIRYVGIRHVGPRNRDGFVFGRYGLHFHHMRDNSRGSLVEGVVIRDNGSHSYVPHAAHGITIRDSVAYKVKKTAFWWDRPPGPENDTFDSVWDHNLAADIVPNADEQDLRASGFQLGTGNQRSNTPTNTIRDSVAVGVRGQRVNNGFHWPQASAGVWRFARNVSHNNQVAAFFWTNDAVAHDMPGFRAYNNAIGLMHGAYRNVGVWEDLRIVGTTNAAVNLLAVSGDARTMALRDVTIIGAREGLLIGRHNVVPEERALLERWVLQGVTSPVVINEEIGQEGGKYDLIDWTVNGRPLACSDFRRVRMHPDSVLRIVSDGAVQHRVTAQGCFLPRRRR